MRFSQVLIFSGILLINARGSIVTGEDCKFGSACDIEEKRAGCYNCLKALKNVECPDGYEPRRAVKEGCGVLKIGCTYYCKWTGPCDKDYGCGCGLGTSCYDVDCETTNWSKFGECVLSDGTPLEDICDHTPGATGTKTRTRSIKTQNEFDGKQCGALVDTRTCSCPESAEPAPLCQEYMDWSGWSSCEATTSVGDSAGQCAGTKFKSRVVNDLSTCTVKEVETKHKECTAPCA